MLAACIIMSGAVTARTLGRVTVVLTPSVTVAKIICEREERRQGKERGRGGRGGKRGEGRKGG